MVQQINSVVVVVIVDDVDQVWVAKDVLFNFTLHTTEATKW